MSEFEHWNERYRSADTPWDTGRPSSELVRVLAEQGIQPCRAIDLGCGTGTNAIWLAQQGFDVTGVDLIPLAIQRAEEQARQRGVRLRLLAIDLLDPPDLGEPFDFFFDRGCYHVVRRVDVGRYLRTLERITHPGSLGLVLTGNAREAQSPGPPVVAEAELRGELSGLFDFVQLREFRFDETAQHLTRPLAWSCLLRRRSP
jgi:2-polyprenyl-3-methyl-5-hydroxy-6-metoxy-1,4-benzoquinol methylase